MRFDIYCLPKFIEGLVLSRVASCPGQTGEKALKLGGTEGNVRIIFRLDFLVGK